MDQFPVLHQNCSIRQIHLSILAHWMHRICNWNLVLKMKSFPANKKVEELWYLCVWSCVSCTHSAELVTVVNFHSLVCWAEHVSRGRTGKQAPEQIELFTSSWIRSKICFRFVSAEGKDLFPIQQNAVSPERQQQQWFLEPRGYDLLVVQWAV